MADLTKTIQILFEGVDNVSGSFDTIGAGLNELNGAIGQVTSPFAGFTENLLKAEAAILALGAAFAAISVNEAGKFDDAMREVGTLFGAMPEDVERLKKEVLDFAKSSTQAIPDITAAMYNAVSATGDWENAVKFLADAEKLAVAGATDLSSSVNLLTTVMGAYGAETSQAGDYSDALFTTVKLGKTTIDELASQMGRVAGQASAAGVDVETLGAAIGALTVYLGSTEQATTTFAALLKELSNPSKALADALGDTTFNGKNLDEVLRKLNEATGGSYTEMSKLFGSVEATKAALALSTDAAGKFSEGLAMMRDNAGATEQAYKAMADSFENVNKQLANNVNVVLIQVGDKILETYKDIVKSITALFQGIQDAIEQGSFDPLFKFLNEKGAELAEFFRGVAAALPEALAQVDFSGLIASFERLDGAIGEILGKLFEGLDPRKPDELAKILQKVVDALAAMTSASTGAIGPIGDYINQIKKLADMFVQMDPAQLEKIGEGLGSLTVLNEISGHVETFLGVGEGLLTLLTGLAAVHITKGVMALASAIGGAAVAGSLGAVLLALGTLLAAGWAGWKLSDWVFELPPVAAAVDKLSSALAKLNTVGGDSGKIESTSETLKRLADSGVIAEASMKAFSEAVARGDIVFDKASNAWVKAEMTLTKMADGTDVAVDQFGNLYTVVTDTSTGITKYEAVIKSADGAVSGLGKEADSAAADTKKLRTELEKIASDERLKSMEFEIDLRIEQVKANAQIASAAFKSLSTTIQSTGDLLGKLYGMLGDEKNAAYVTKILEQIEKENAAREAAFKSQQDWFKANIDYLNARTDKLKSDDALIQIDGAGLQAHLEAFMFEILAAIQVKLNDEGLELLTGLQLPSPGAV